MSTLTENHILMEALQKIPFKCLSLVKAGSTAVEFPDEVVFTKTETPERTTFQVGMRKTDLPKSSAKAGTRFNPSAPP